jgi:hypothetical protein
MLMPRLFLERKRRYEENINKNVKEKNNGREQTGRVKQEKEDMYKEKEE